MNLTEKYAFEVAKDMNNELTQEEKELIMDYISCAYGEGYSGGGEPYTKKINVNDAIKSIGRKLGFSNAKINHIFE